MFFCVVRAVQNVSPSLHKQHHKQTKPKILGRASVDIIKTGGYKVSALDVEGALLRCPRVAEAAVLGLEHAALGQQVAALVVLADDDVDDSTAAEEIAAWCAARLPPYAAPRVTKLLRAPLPRNAMGKLAKKELAKQFFGGGGGGGGDAASS